MCFDFFCQKCSNLSFASILSKMAHFVILEKRSSNYEISMISLHHMLWAIRFNFVKNAQFCHLSERPVYFFTFQYCHQRPILSFWKRGIQIMRYSMCAICDLNYFASSILSEMVNFIIFWETCVFFSLFQFVKNGSFCHFGKAVFKLWDKYDFSTPYVVSHQTILSKMLNFVIFWEARVYFHFSILSPKAHFVILEKRNSNYEI